MINRYPITTRLYALGVPVWIGFAAAGAPLAAFVGLIALMVVLCT